MKGYQHLNLLEREELYALRCQGYTFREIGKVLHRSHTTLAREYGRHAKYGKPYMPCKAQAVADKVSLYQRSTCGLKNHKIFLYVRQRLRKHWSPETIAGRLSLDYPEQSIHHETIYRYIYNSNKTRGMRLWRYLTLHRKRRMKFYGRKVKSDKINNMLSIDLRPKEVELRQKLGHWETDNVEGKKSDLTALSTTVERVTRYTILSKLQSHKAKEKREKVVGRLLKLPSQAIQSLTADRGSENKEHEKMRQRLKVPIYFCQPYHSWEKGTVENTNGRVRRYLPKGMSLDPITDKDIEIIERELNNTPRKCLNYLTPYEKMQELLQTNSGALPARI